MAARNDPVDNHPVATIDRGCDCGAVQGGSQGVTQVSPRVVVFVLHVCVSTSHVTVTLTHLWPWETPGLCVEPRVGCDCVLQGDRVAQGDRK